MMFSDFKIGTRLSVGIALIVVLFTVLALFGINRMELLSRDTSLMYRHPLTVSTALLRIESNIIRMHRTMKDVALSKDSVEIESLSNVVDKLEKTVYDDFKIIDERFLGQKTLYTHAYDTFDAWKPIRDEVLALMYSDRRTDAADITKGKGARHVEKMEGALKELSDFAANKAIEFLNQAEATKSGALRLMYSLLVITIFVGGIFAIFLTRSITGPITKLNKAMLEIGSGYLDTHVDVNSADEVGELGKEIQDVTRRLNEVSEVARGVAAGDFSGKVIVKGGHDVLGLAINTMVDNFASVTRQAEVIAGGDYSSDIMPRSSMDTLGIALRNMTNSLRETSADNIKQDWLKKGLLGVNETMQGELDLITLASNVVTFFSKYLGAQIGAMYVASSDGDTLKLTASYAFTGPEEFSGIIKVGEGIVGQVALDMKAVSVTDIPKDYIRISSGTGGSIPRHLLVVPFTYEGKLKGIVELGSFDPFPDDVMELIDASIEIIGMGVHAADTRTQLQLLFEETQRQAEELQSQQEELKSSNEELEEQTMALKESEQSLKAQQEELQATNEELEEKTESLERQKVEVQDKNNMLEQTRIEIEEKAEDLRISSQYKSEFMANMSHELRTPLNSLLLLARNLSENKDDNLSDNQLESAKIIYNSGRDLLDLINEILDLSKIEAGKMELEISETEPVVIAESIMANFKHMIEEKGLGFSVQIDEDVPGTFQTDPRRLGQVIKNIMSNSIKFTREGTITVSFKKIGPNDKPTASALKGKEGLAISIKDTGIGIHKEKQQVIFEAFQQVDGSTSRKYGGTGLGLSISRELMRILGGEITLESTHKEGSTFTLYLPLELGAEVVTAQGTGEKGREKAQKPFAPAKARPLPPPPSPLRAPTPIEYVPDDRENIKEGDRVILIVEDDPVFARILYKHCHEKDLKCLLAGSGEQGIELAHDYRPSGILLDVKLPGMSGLEVLDTLKDDYTLRHIPVHMMSVLDDTTEALRKGAIGFVTKPVTEEDLDSAFTRLVEMVGKELKDLLIIEDDQGLRKGVVKLMGNGDIRITEASTGKGALTALKKKRFDCIILDIGLPDMTGFELLKKLEKKKNFVIPPIIIFTGRELTKEQDTALRKYTDTIIIKGVKSEERLLDEASLFLHRVVANMPKRKRKMITDLHDKDVLFKGKKVLVVDDDMRNVFALSAVLSEKGVEVLKAEDGEKALEALALTPDVDLVLMDIMMPVMDGYETIKRIRAQDKFWKLPIIALTAKAMKEDKEKCIAAGANDYISKPVDIDRLKSMMRVWLYR